MPEVRPYRGILYNSTKVSPTDVVAPPYDVISTQQQGELYDRNTYNIIRLILGREEDRYKSAAKYFEDWKNSSIMVHDEKAVIYALVQNFDFPERNPIERRGIIAALRLEDYGAGSINPHEKTHSAPKEDRFKLFRTTNAMFDQILSLYSDPQHNIDDFLSNYTDSSPIIDVTFEQVRNRVWRIRGDIAYAGIASFFTNRKIIIADGHHRYETALRYRDLMRSKNPRHSGDEPYNFIPMYFTNMDSPGLCILPTHRILSNISDFSSAQLLESLKTYFHFDVQTTAEELLHNLSSRREFAFGVILPTPPEFVLIWLKNREVIKSLNLPEILSQLDVSLLDTIILKNIFHISDETTDKKANVSYENEATRAIRMVKEGKADVAFLLNSTKIDQLKAVTESKYTMPPKSTYFYPKLLSGIVSYSFIDK
ncbi:MAG TPA: DUF1015 domain-containing protein [Bacteroidota bacterium]|nr:DUF1015 domain-containing protein [Bacteroidota bacterium]